MRMIWPWPNPSKTRRPEILRPSQGNTGSNRSAIRAPCCKRYLLATTFDYPNAYHYAVHRIQRAEISDAPAKRPKSFSLNAFLANGGGQFGSGNEIPLRAHLSDELAAILRETAISPDQKISTRAGRHTLTATVKDSWQLHFWILSQGPFITILQPASLRKEIVSKLTNSLANYTAT